MERLSRRFLFSSRVRYCVGVGCQGGKIRSGSGQQFLDVFVHRGLVAFGREQVIASTLQHHLPARLSLGVQRIQRDELAAQIHFLEELAGDGDLVGLGIHDRAGQVILAGHANSAQDGLAAPVFGFFAIQGDQLVFGRWAAQPLLHLQHDRFEPNAVNLLEQAAPGGLAGPTRSGSAG